MRFTSNNSAIYVSWYGNQLSSYDTSSGQEKSSIKSSIIPRIAYLGEDRFLGFVYRGANSGDLVIARLSDGRRIATLRENIHSLEKVELLADHTAIACVDKEKTLIYRDMTVNDAVTVMERNDEDSLREWCRELETIRMRDYDASLIK